MRGTVAVSERPVGLTSCAATRAASVPNWTVAPGQKPVPSRRSLVPGRRSCGVLATVSGVEVPLRKYPVTLPGCWANFTRSVTVPNTPA